MRGIKSAQDKDKQQKLQQV